MNQKIDTEKEGNWKPRKPSQYSMMKRCVCCGEDRRIDRMSMHLLEKHRDVIVATSNNKHLIDECIKSKNGYMRVVLKTDTGTDDYFVSFGYNSGWSGKPKMSKVLDKIKQHRDAHIEICTALLSEILAYEKEKKAPTSTTSEAKSSVESSMEMKLLTSRYEDLLNKYKGLEKKAERVELSNSRLLTNIDKKDEALNILLKFYNIDHLLYSCIADEVGLIWDEYPPCPSDDDKDDEHKEMREKLIAAISFEEMKKNAAYDASCDDY